MIENFTHKQIENFINYKSLEKTNIKNILITGCGGFIGGYLVSALLSKKNKKKFNIFGLDIIKPQLDKNLTSIDRFLYTKRFNSIKKL